MEDESKWMGLGNCGYDTVEGAFKYMYGLLDRKFKKGVKDKTEDYASLGTLMPFD